jgi:16S rRNA (adenine1518-N6/adenine1519-N6)-dimethyltransferase
MWTQTTLRQALESRGLRPRKGLGQHFLIDPNFCRFIVRAAEVPADADAIEIGAGPGLLTAHLAPAVARLRAVEIDPAMADLCRRAVGDHRHVEILERDVLGPDGRIGLPAPARLPGGGPGEIAPFVFGNLPYNRSVGILVALLAWDRPWSQALVVVQREVGDRLRARPGGEAYGPLSAVAQAAASVTVLRAIPPRVFWPPPRVESALVRLRPRQDRRIAAGDVASVWAFLQRLFHLRRKRLATVLKALDLEDAIIARLCDRTGVSATDRAEQLEPDVLVEIALAALRA